MPRSEGQPRLVQRLLHPLRRGNESDTRRQSPLQQTSYMDNPNLTHEDKVYLLMRAREPKASTTGVFQAWLTYDNRREQQDRENLARGEPSHPVPLEPEKLHFNTATTLTSEQRRQRNLAVVNALDRQLHREVQERQFVEIAQDIRKTMWRDTDKRYPFGRVERTGHAKIGIKDYGTVMNRSRAGVTLTHRMVKNKVFLGIGYVGVEDRTHILPEAQAVLSNDKLTRGMKAYFVEQTKANGTKSLVIIPFAYAESKQRFLEQLYKTARGITAEPYAPILLERRSLKAA